MAIKLFFNIGEMLTLKGASQKKARSIKESDLSVIEKACLVVKDDEIVWLGKESDLKKENYEIDEEFDVQGKMLMPGFIDPHTHLVFAGDRRNEFEMRNAGASYLEISKAGGGIANTVKATREISYGDLLKISQERVDNFIEQGVTTVEIKSGYGLDLETEIKILKVAQSLKKIRKCVTYLGPHSLPGEFKSLDEYMNFIIEKALPEICEQKLCSRADIFIENGFFTIEQAKKYISKIKEFGLDLTIHADQLTRTGAGELASENKALSADHLVELSEQDISKMASSETTCVLLPTADYYLQMDYPQARKMIDENCRVALGTDFNPGSSPTQNISFLGQLSRLKMKMTLPEVICAMTLGAAYALGLETQIGSLEESKQADFVILNSSWKDLFYGLESMPVSSVWSRGEQLI